jgi:hypothetical protein
MLERLAAAAAAAAVGAEVSITSSKVTSALVVVVARVALAYLRGLLAAQQTLLPLHMHMVLLEQAAQYRVLVVRVTEVTDCPKAAGVAVAVLAVGGARQGLRATLSFLVAATTGRTEVALAATAPHLAPTQTSHGQQQARALEL